MNLLVRDIPLMELFIIFDGIICATLFLKEYVLLKLVEHKVNVMETYKEIVFKYNNLYIINFVNRYALYLSVHFIFLYFILKTHFHHSKKSSTLMIYLTLSKPSLTMQKLTASFYTAAGVDAFASQFLAAFGRLYAVCVEDLAVVTEDVRDACCLTHLRTKLPAAALYF